MVLQNNSDSTELSAASQINEAFSDNSAVEPGLNSNVATSSEHTPAEGPTSSKIEISESNIVESPHKAKPEKTEKIEKHYFCYCDTETIVEIPDIKKPFPVNQVTGFEFDGYFCDSESVKSSGNERRYFHHIEDELNLVFAAFDEYDKVDPSIQELLDKRCKSNVLYVVWNIWDSNIDIMTPAKGEGYTMRDVPVGAKGVTLYDMEGNILDPHDDIF